MVGLERATLVRQAVEIADFEREADAHLLDQRDASDLFTLLSRMRATATHDDRLVWLESLGQWVHGSSVLPMSADGDDERTRRFRGLVKIVGLFAPFREDFAALLTGFMSDLRGTRLFADVGIPVEPGFWREAVDRISRTLLPKAPTPRSFADFVSRVFPTENEARWLERSPPDLWIELWESISKSQSPLSLAWPTLSHSMADAMRILAVRIAALGVAQDVRDRLPNVPVSQLPFLRLPRMCEAIEFEPTPRQGSNEQALATIAECRTALQSVRDHIEQSGVSVDLVYRIELIGAELSRVEQLVVLLVPDPSAIASQFGRFSLSLVQAQFQGRSVIDLLRANSHLLARKIVERAGKTGGHYITHSFAEWKAMLRSAAGGGFLTAFTAAFKVLFAAMAMPAFFATLFACLNYAGSFLLMGALGFTLATKQPSMTAAALASSLETEKGKPPPIERLVALTAQISRSQLAAVIGNIGMVIPTALLFDLAWRAVTGHPLLTSAKASYVVQSLHPLKSGTLFYAGVTGVLLWLSSIGAGWLENWVTYRQLPQALAEDRRLIRILGTSATRWIGQVVERGAAPFGGSVSLGVLLGVVPQIGVFFGVPLDVRHVTLSTGSLVFAGSTLGWQALVTNDYLFALAGIGIIGLLNFGLSFAMALAVAFRAGDAWRTSSRVFVKRVVRALAAHLRREPLKFLWPPKGG